MTDYIPYQAMHMVFGEPEKGIATGQLFMPNGSEQEVYIEENGSTFTVYAYRGGTVLNSGGSIIAALEGTGARGWDFSQWLPAYDTLFTKVQAEDTWDPDYLREVAEGEELMTDELTAALNAYDKFYSK